jgi:hypothetical protein
MECKRCKKDLDEDSFPSNGVGGLRHQCKECMREINQRWRRLNKGKVAVYNKNRKKSVGTDQLPLGEPKGDIGPVGSTGL